MRTYLLLFLLLVPSVLGAQVHGDLYDLYLNPIDHAVVSVDTTPIQRFIITNHSYSINLPNGTFTLHAQSLQGQFVTGTAQESITITHEGDYTIDFIIAPDLDQGLELNDSDFDLSSTEVEQSGSAWPLALAIFAILAIFLFARRKQTKDSRPIHDEPAPRSPSTETIEPTDIDKALDIIKKEGGRISQKDLRAHFPLSEAKVSLMIAEMEHKGLIQKFKVGRGNVLVAKQAKLK